MDKWVDVWNGGMVDTGRNEEAGWIDRRMGVD